MVDEKKVQKKVTRKKDAKIKAKKDGVSSVDDGFPNNVFRMLSSKSMFFWINIVVGFIAFFSWQSWRILSTAGERQVVVPQATAAAGDNDDPVLGGKERKLDPIVQRRIQVINKSELKVDFYFDDGGHGSLLGTAEPGGDELFIHSAVGADFFVTRHGVKEVMYDSETEDIVKFKAKGIEGETFVIPENAERGGNKCLDIYNICKQYKKDGSCHETPGWMVVHCCKSCDDELNAAELLDPRVRCSPERLNITGESLQPGDLNALFTSWTTDEKFKKYDPQVLSSPMDSDSDVEISFNLDGEIEDTSPPWIITFDNFMTDKEVADLIKGGEISGFQKSTKAGALRTSSSAWCYDECEKLPGVQSLKEKIQDVTGIPTTYSETFEILQYEENQYYQRHHDTNKQRQISGPRVLTIFLYLSDVEEGGETYFDTLDITVKPKKGRALVWPSVKSEDPITRDERMFHETKPVIKGKKYVSNYWIHLFDFQTPNLWGCTGGFA